VVDERCANMVWSHPRVTSWYKNAAGRVTVNSPWKQLEYWQITQRFEPSEYLCVPRTEVKPSATEFVTDDVE
jgi:4-hydroxyacetophenone monooxygenase